MSDSQQNPWSDNPNAPKIPYQAYFYEKAWFAGNLVTSIFYGIIVVMFFKCIAALFDPAHRRGEPIKWRLVSYTAVMFSLVTIGTAMQLDFQSVSYIDNREFPGVEGILPPGPIGYQWLIAPEATGVIQNIAFVLGAWLADGFLLYRCYIVYSMKLWVIAFPCLMYLGSLAMGIVLVYQNIEVSGPIWSNVPYYSISLSLNVLLTLMITVRLILHARNTRTALGIPGVGGLCKAIVTMLVESCALYAINSLLVVVPLGLNNPLTNVFGSILTETQVIAPLLIVLRVANKSALTSKTIVSGRIDEFEARTRGELTGGTGAPPGGDLMNFAGGRGIDSDPLGVGVQIRDIDSHQDEL